MHAAMLDEDEMMFGVKTPKHRSKTRRVKEEMGAGKQVKEKFEMERKNIPPLRQLS